ncbi:MAG: hypothetical protein ACOX0F_02870 [Syntrophomonadaceae bacterium]|jgi:hypothetical protein
MKAMRFMLGLFSISILIMLVAAGLNISNQGINDLTMNNQGPVIAIRIEGYEACIEALGNTYHFNEDTLKDGQARLHKEAARCRLYVQSFWRHCQQQWLPAH